MVRLDGKVQARKAVPGSESKGKVITRGVALVLVVHVDVGLKVGQGGGAARGVDTAVHKTW